MTSHREGPTSFRDQLRATAERSAPVPDRADVMVRALFALQYADRWLAEQVEDSAIAMRGTESQVPRRYVASHQNVEILVEAGAELRVIGAVEPPSPGWALIRAGVHRSLVRIDEDGMFTATVPADAGSIDVALEFDDGTTVTMKGVND